VERVKSAKLLCKQREEAEKEEEEEEEVSRRKIL
jgi:hypothetical protein